MKIKGFLHICIDTTVRSINYKEEEISSDILRSSDNEDFWHLLNAHLDTSCTFNANTLPKIKKFIYKRRKIYVYLAVNVTDFTNAINMSSLS